MEVEVEREEVSIRCWEGNRFERREGKRMERRVNNGRECKKKEEGIRRE